MPSIETDSNSISWADQVEQGESGVLPPTLEDYDRETGYKTITEYKRNDDGKLVKIVKTYKVERKLVPKTIARRKEWKKFGASEFDGPGPNASTTIISEDIQMQFINSREVQHEVEEDPLGKLKNQKIVTCRTCKGDHWTTKCPYKDTLAPIQEKLQEDTKKAPAEPQAPAQAKTAKYIPPSLREGANRRGEAAPGSSQKRDETATIRVTNLSEDTRETDLQELFRPFGPIQRIYLAKDKVTGQSKGFAFINFYRREDAARAISGVSGFGYDHLILNVEWANPFIKTGRITLTGKVLEARKWASLKQQAAFRKYIRTLRGGGTLLKISVYLSD